MPVIYAEIEERVIEAFKPLETQEFPNIAQITREFDAAEGRVRRRFHGKVSRTAAGGQNKVLNKAADRSLCLYIELAEEIGLPIREKTLVIAANAILRNHHDPTYEEPPRIVSQPWAARWLSRHPEYQKMTKNPLAIERKNTHNPIAIQRWFHKLLAVKIKYGIVDTDIYSMNETGFTIDIRRAHKVITRAGNQR
jgi:Tc5 transposase DNA-binding domain